jgi:hypothetical protein
VPTWEILDSAAPARGCAGQEGVGIPRVALSTAECPPGADLKDIRFRIISRPVLSNSAEDRLLTLTGGAIGQGLPVAAGAAGAAPDRPVVGLQADGGTMYTIQALWNNAGDP